jgi:glycine/D-amino acid oxidase-like deaminating enzyme
MDLHSGIPYWLAANGLLADYPQLDRDLPYEDVVIIGTGISGALAAHELCSRGSRVTMLDSRMVSAGSTWASTAHLNYEIDVPLYRLIKWYGEEAGVAIYKANLGSISRIEQVLEDTGADAGFRRRSSLYLASDGQGKKELSKEYKVRSKYELPVEIVEANSLNDDWLLDYKLALHHNQAAEMDAYRATSGIIAHHVKQGCLQVYTRTAVKKVKSDSMGVHMLTTAGHQILAKVVVCAAGYEAAAFLPKKLATLHSTYAMVSQPMPEELLWKERALIWETARPYFYLRTTTDNRIMMGGLDEPFQKPEARDALMDEKTGMLIKQCRKMFPHLPGILPEFKWCGTFAETGDGLPYIGEYPGSDHIYYALGYGGNGITFSMTAAEIVANAIWGKRDERSGLFSFGRKKK